MHRSQKSLWSTKNAQNKWLDYYYINSQIIRLLFNDCNAVIVYFIFWFVSPNILNTWHICGTTALSFGSVCALWVGLTAHVQKNCCSQLMTHGMFNSCSWIDSGANHILTKAPPTRIQIFWKRRIYRFEQLVWKYSHASRQKCENAYMNRPVHW